MSDFIYCPICDRRASIDEASYVSMIPEERKKDLLFFKPTLTDADMVCMECEMNYETH